MAATSSYQPPGGALAAVKMAEESERAGLRALATGWIDGARR